jgi:hypothetical protein
MTTIGVDKTGAPPTPDQAAIEKFKAQLWGKLVQPAD